MIDLKTKEITNYTSLNKVLYFGISIIFRKMNEIMKNGSLQKQLRFCFSLNSGQKTKGDKNLRKQPVLHRKGMI